MTTEYITRALPKTSLLLVAALTWISPSASALEHLQVTDNAIINSGHHVFAAKCAACHGEEGKGDGPFAAQLTTRPADLTVLARKNGGVFPFWRVYETISGSELMPAHGTRDMPIWGQELAAEAMGADQATFVRGRILEIIAWLRSIQQD